MEAIRKQEMLASASRTIKMQASAVAQLESYLDEDFVDAVEMIASCKGRIVVSGIGKSAIIAQKLVATLNSTGTPSLFLHAADAIHGDLGMVQQDDIVIIISKSGDSPEIKLLVPLVRNFGNKMIAIAGNAESFLAINADLFLNSTVQQEACPHNLAPTTSTTAQMVMGDALAICLMHMKEFSSGDFAKYHPGGVLGKKLYLKVGDMVMPEENPKVYEDTMIKEVLLEITKKRLGAAAVLNADGKVIGIITDGDIRRMLEKYDDFKDITAAHIMSENPKQIDAQALAVEAYSLLKENNISQLIVKSGNGYKGILHIHDIMREGII